MWEPMLLDLPEEMPRVDFEEHKTRYRTLQAIARQYRAHPGTVRHREGVAAARARGACTRDCHRSKLSLRRTARVRLARVLTHPPSAPR